MALGNPFSTAPLVGEFNTDQMPALQFQNGAQVGLLLDYNFVTATNTTGFTATQAQIASASDNFLALTGTLAAGANIQLPTVATAAAAVPGGETVGGSIILRIINRSSANFAWTVTTNTGWTLTGTMTIAQNTWRDFIATVTGVTNGAASTATLQAVGTGTDS